MIIYFRVRVSPQILYNIMEDVGFGRPGRNRQNYSYFFNTERSASRNMSA